MLAKLKAVKDKASGLIDKAQVKAVGLLVETLHPKVGSSPPSLTRREAAAADEAVRCHQPGGPALVMHHLTHPHTPLHHNSPQQSTHCRCTQ
jgi:hypothetical protein